MHTLLTVGRRLLSLNPLSARIFMPVAAPIEYWWRSWKTNRSKIFTLTFFNTMLTTVNECISRTVAAHLLHQSVATSFLVATAAGGWMIHRQSLINIWMTVFASLLGGPVYFFANRTSRFIFFVGFGLFNSVLSQSMTGLFSESAQHVANNRILFDLIYSATVKFGMFELFRTRIVESRGFNIGALRVSQDLLTTFGRVLLLNMLRFSG